MTCLEKSRFRDKELGGPNNYVLISPIKDEEKNLPNLIESVANQTIKPSLWVIVDDCSQDSSPLIIEKAKRKYKWISSIRLDEEKRRDSWFRISLVLKEGVNFCYEHANKNGLNFDYLGTIDGDVILDKDYYEKLLNKFKEDPKLGVASGEPFYLIEKSKVVPAGDSSPGAVKLIRRKCFEECGGIPVTRAWDSVFNIKAVIRGWKVKQFHDAKFYVTRQVFSAEGLWKGYKEFGKSSYYLGFNFIHALGKGLMLTFRRPHYVGLAYLVGYLSSLILREEQIDDEEVRNYNKYSRIKNAILRYLKYPRGN